MHKNKIFTTHSNRFRKDFNSNDYVTIFTDASHCPDTNAAGWGGWCKHGSEGSKITHGESFVTANSTTAELIGIQRMIQHCIDQGVNFKGKWVIIQCDCTDALAKCDTRQLRELGTRNIKLKHVPGHKGNADKRTSVNTKTDSIARKYMLAKRKELSNA